MPSTPAGPTGEGTTWTCDHARRRDREQLLGDLLVRPARASRPTPSHPAAPRRRRPSARGCRVATVRDARLGDLRRQLLAQRRQRRLVVERVPAVPQVRVRRTTSRSHPRSRPERADEDRRPRLAASRRELAVARGVELALEVDTTLAQQRHDDPQRLLEPGDRALDRDAEPPELAPVVAGAQAGDQPAAADLVDRVRRGGPAGPGSGTPVQATSVPSSTRGRRRRQAGEQRPRVPASRCRAAGGRSTPSSGASQSSSISMWSQTHRESKPASSASRAVSRMSRPAGAARVRIARPRGQPFAGRPRRQEQPDPQRPRLGRRPCRPSSLCPGTWHTIQTSASPHSEPSAHARRPVARHALPHPHLRGAARGRRRDEREARRLGPPAARLREADLHRPPRPARDHPGRDRRGRRPRGARDGEQRCAPSSWSRSRARSPLRQPGHREREARDRRRGAPGAHGHDPQRGEDAAVLRQRPRRDDRRERSGCGTATSTSGATRCSAACSSAAASSRRSARSTTRTASSRSRRRT